MVARKLSCIREEMLLSGGMKLLRLIFARRRCLVLRPLIPALYTLGTTKKQLNIGVQTVTIRTVVCELSEKTSTGPMFSNVPTPYIPIIAMLVIHLFLLQHYSYFIFPSNIQQCQRFFPYRSYWSRRLIPCAVRFFGWS